MDIWQAILLGVIEGITEYLPVSSTGHLVVAQKLMGLGSLSAQEKAAADAFAVCIQSGAILAVLGIYSKRIWGMFLGLLGKSPEGLKLLLMLVISFLPAAVIGTLLNDWIEARLFQMWPIVAAWIVGGFAILLVGKKVENPASGNRAKSLAEITIRAALIIGLLQCIAMWPGTSRSLMTMVGGLLVGLSMSAAVEYSFLLGLLTLGAATCKKAIFKVHDIDPIYDTWFGGVKLMLDTYHAIPLIFGMLASTISAFLAVKWLISYLKSRGLSVFGWYRIAVGAVVAGLILSGIISA